MHLVGRSAGANRYPIALAGDALEVANQKRDQIRRHFRRRRKTNGAYSHLRTRRVRDDVRIRDRRVTLVDNKSDVERRLESRLVEAGKRPPRIGGFKLRHGIVASGRLRQVEAAQFVVQNAAVFDAERGAPRGQRVVEAERYLFLLRIFGDAGFQFLAVDFRGHAREFDFRRVQRDGIGRLLQQNVDLLAAGEGGVAQIGRQRQRVVFRNCGIGKALTVNGCDEEEEKTSDSCAELRKRHSVPRWKLN